MNKYGTGKTLPMVGFFIAFLEGYDGQTFCKQWMICQYDRARKAFVDSDGTDIGADNFYWLELSDIPSVADSMSAIKLLGEAVDYLPQITAGNYAKGMIAGCREIEKWNLQGRERWPSKLSFPNPSIIQSARRVISQVNDPQVQGKIISLLKGFY